MNLGCGPKRDLVKWGLGFFNLASDSREAKPGILMAGDIDDRLMIVANCSKATHASGSGEKIPTQNYVEQWLAQARY